MKNKFRVATTLVLLLLLVFFTVGRISSVVYVNKKMGIPSEPTSFTMTVPVYYANQDGLLESEERVINITSNTLVEAVVEEMKTLPTQSMLKRLIDDHVRVLKADIYNKTLYLDLSYEFVTSQLWFEQDKRLILQSLANTLTFFDTIEKVQIQVESKDINAYLADEEKVTELTYNDEVIYYEPESAKDVLNSFINFIMIGRYDLAYDLTTASLNGVQDFEDFKFEMTAFRKSRETFEVVRLFSQWNEGSEMIIVQYVFVDKINAMKYDGGFEEWFFDKGADGQLYIVWPRLK